MRTRSEFIIAAALTILITTFGAATPASAFLDFWSRDTAQTTEHVASGQASGPADDATKRRKRPSVNTHRRTGSAKPASSFFSWFKNAKPKAEQAKRGKASRPANRVTKRRKRVSPNTHRRADTAKPARRSTARRTVRRNRIEPTASSTSRRSHESLTDHVNSGRVSIISGGIGGTYVRIAADLAAVLNSSAQGEGADDEDNILRVLPIIGQGSVQNITDILYLKGIDVGIVQSDVLAHIKREQIHANISNRIHYITKLYNEEFHLVGARSIGHIRELEGKKVNFGVNGSGTSMTAATVFDALGIKVVPMHLDQALAIQKLKDGEIAASVYVAGKPAKAVSELTGAAGLHLIAVDYAGGLQAAYLPAQFTAEDYPELVPAGTTVNSIAVGAVMAVYNWPAKNARGKRVNRFVERFFARIDAFRKPPRHKKWLEVNIEAEVPGWTRYAPAAAWLKANAADSQAGVRTAFNRFLTANASNGDIASIGSTEREALFQKFLKWWKQRDK